jgi:hypothetical protein
MKNPKSIRSLFSLPGFVAASALGGVFGDRYARVIVLRRRKNRRVLAVRPPRSRPLRQAHLLSS